MKTILILTFLTSLSGFAFSLSDEREYLDDLKEKRFVKYDDYDKPHLVVSAAGRIDLLVAQLYPVVQKHLREYRVDFRGRFGQEGAKASEITRANFPLPTLAVSGEQLEGIKSCSIEKCLNKLRDGDEKEQMAASKNKLGTYHQLVLNRVRDYLENGELAGYEERKSNISTVREVFGGLPDFKKAYPQVWGFFHDGAWRKSEKPAFLTSSFLRQEMVIIAPDRMQPILRIGDVHEFKLADRYVWVELHVYTNHYFDSSLRIIELYPWGKGASALALTDILEVDELKKSGLIRALFKGKMVSAVEKYQQEELKKLGVYGTPLVGER